MQKVTLHTLEDTMVYRDIPVFIYKIKYPSFTTSCSPVSAGIINDYYSQLAQNAETYCRTVLFTQAAESAKYMQPGSAFNSYTFDMDYQITYNEGCLVSLFMDAYTYMGGAHGETKRTSDTWNFKSGTRMRLADFYPFTPATLYRLQQSIVRQIEERIYSSPGSYFENYKSLLLQTFHVDNFYLKPDNCVIYFQQYDIAPYSTGIPEFNIPIEISDQWSSP